MSKLYYLIGLPRSGKSTYANHWVREKTMPDANPRIVVCADDLRLAVTGQRWQPNCEPIVQGIKHTIIRAYLTRGYDVLVDGTHSTLYSIRELFWINPEAVAVWHPISKYTWSEHPRYNQARTIDAHIKMCKQRAIDTNQEDLLGPIDRIANNLKKLAYDFDTKIFNLRQEVSRGN